MKKIILFAALSLSVNLVMAEGGNVRDQNPIYDVNGNVIGFTVPVPEPCEVVIPQSGKSVVIICEDGN